MKRVVIFQYRLLHYRTTLFDKLKAACAQRGIDLHLVHGQATRSEATKKDVGHLPWARTVKNRYITVRGRDILWQPFPSELRNADLVILMQENRLLSNYPILLRRHFTPTKVAFWGHGKNFQSRAPNGLREKWKNALIGQVDWWFAYTQSTVGILEETGFPKDKITCLDNAIDTSGFRQDLEQVAIGDIAAERHRLGIPDGAAVGLFCGSLYPDKRLELLVDAADQIKAAVPDFHVVVIGDGPSRSFINTAASTRPWLHPVGIQQGGAKALYFRMADLMLNPGLVGLHIVDAFCAGLVMVTTRTARHSPEIAYLIDGDNGLMTGDTPTEYAQAIIDLLSAPDRLRTMRARALACSQRYTLDNMVDNFANGIEAAVHG